jgi:YtoQ family protein
MIQKKLGGIYMELTVYLAGHIHDQWREEFRSQAKQRNLPITFVGPQENHELSDQIGEKIIGEQPAAKYTDEAASQINNLRTRVLMNKVDVVVALFGDKFKQWNTAMDAATAIQMDKPLILVRPEAHVHALKEMADKAQVVVETKEQAIQALAYIFE